MCRVSRHANPECVYHAQSKLPLIRGEEEEQWHGMMGAGRDVGSGSGSGTGSESGRTEG